MNTLQDSSSESSDALSTSPSPLLSSSGVSGGEGRQLPSIPNPNRLTNNMDAAVKPSSKQVPPIRGTCGYGPFLQEYSMMAEYNQLLKQKLPGMYVMPSAKYRFLWNGVLFLREKLYAGGALRFTMTIPDNYPDGDCPDFVFEFPIFHPLVDPITGRVDVKRAFPKWRRNVDHLWQVLMYARKIFYKIETKAPLNIEAATLYEQNLDKFKQHVNDSIKAAKQRLMQSPSSDDPFALRFSPWTQPVHGEARQEMLKSKECHSREPSANPCDLGLSWMKPGCTQVFAYDDFGST
ncbi:AKT-interacting protein-like isoform X1 [Pomacea canaliculata]|uniref:AKT-interacting protein-like isoform X1 n=1 Tax=Pomacea canaliculata TaxID=400727 RepID=UPI000D72AEA7|nr:AKT-interacting protein-like isoform X1 [Pomacea canaliculata]